MGSQSKQREAYLTSRVPAALCPACGCVLDAATGTALHAPRPSDFGICCQCRIIFVFDSQRKPRPMTPDDWAEIAGSARLLAEIQELRGILASNPPPPRFW